MNKHINEQFVLASANSENLLIERNEITMNSMKITIKIMQIVWNTSRHHVHDEILNVTLQ